MMLFIVLGVTLAIAILLAYGSARWQSATKAMHAKLEAARRSVDSKAFSFSELTDLPEPVQRYLRAALEDGQPTISAASVEHIGTFNMSEAGEQWRPFRSTQRVIIQRPGFDWEARIKMTPGLTARVHDAYIAGEGMLHASLFGLLSLVKLRGTPEVNEGELMRFLAETAWYPTALLPSQGVRWEGVDASSAKATLKDGETTVTLLFGFNDDDLIESVRAEARARMVQGRVMPTPWEGRWSHYELRDGMRIPTQGEVAWVHSEGPKPYWRGRVTKLSYEFSE